MYFNNIQIDRRTFIQYNSHLQYIRPDGNAFRPSGALEIP